MGLRVLIDAPTMAIDDPADGAFRITAPEHRNCSPILAVDGLAGDEEVYLWYNTGFGWVPVEAPSNDGAQVTFTTSYSADICNGAGLFGITKTSTASPIKLTIQTGRE